MGEYMKRVDSPQDLKRLSREELKSLAAEIREAIIERVDAIGGHLGSNLGAVEAEIALHYVFDSPNDKIVFDVSHQCYTHKALTGRRGFLEEGTYRDYLGFTDHRESLHDSFSVGHTSTSVSLASGLAKARDLRGTSENVIAFLGDGSLSGGEAFEGLDYVAEMGTNFIVVFNDNEMSIAEPHGGLYRNLKQLRDSNGSCELNLFRAIGFDYRYVEGGNDIDALIDAFAAVRDIDHPVVVHIHTEKGLGSEWAVNDKEPGHYGMPKGFKPSGGKGSNEYTREFLEAKTAADPTVCVVNAATPSAFGMNRAWRERMGKQFVDVGIAEEHAVAMISGMAKGGAKPVFIVNGTFLQRTYDQLMQDLALNENPAVILVSGAGIGTGDATHNGTQIGSLLANIPNVMAFAPSNIDDYLVLLDWAIEQTEAPVILNIPAAVPKGSPAIHPADAVRYQVKTRGSRVAFVGFGNALRLAEATAEIFRADGITATVIDPVIYSAVDTATLDGLLSDHDVIVTVEDNQKDGGYGEKIAAYLGPKDVRVLTYGAAKEFVSNEPRELVMRRYRMTAEQIAEDVRKVL
ncbi:MAG: 1-deoxy-D-xylulose-5-phosphate synthase [Lachnospiraceae bacterium]|nr:1-deoxy-D-xylulose-5-phosphate synthase [Lachnospiraceae bacterium]